MAPPRARILASALALVLGVLGWLLLGPAFLGGGAAYVTVAGASMEPGLHAGDLVLLRPQGSYRVGETIGYRDARLRQVVLHRIVARADDGFVTKGDNNPFRDPTHARAGDIIGTRRAHVPRLGGLLAQARSPLPAAALVGAAVLLPVGRRRRRRSRGGPAARSPANAMSDGRRAAALALAAIGLILAALAVVAYGRPTTATIVVADAYRQTGSFSYRADARPGVAYPSGEVRTGDAVFPDLTRDVAVSFAYRLLSSEPVDVAGRIGLEAVVSDGLGWTRTIPMADERAFRGAAATLTGTLSVDRLRDLTAAFERETGAPPTAYAVTVQPRVTAAGQIGGAPVRASFAPRLSLRLDAVRLAPAPAADGSGAALESTRSGDLTRERPARIAVGALGISVARARTLGLLGCELAFGLALLLGLPLLVAARRSEAGVIRARLGGRLVAVAALPELPAMARVDLERMADLVRVADRAELPIMVAPGAGLAGHYGVVSAGVLYRYSSRPGHGLPAGAEVAT